jgi:hypothetical protein
VAARYDSALAHGQHLRTIRAASRQTASLPIGIRYGKILRKKAMDIDYEEFKDEYEKERLKRFDVWLNEHHQETIELAKKVYGGTAATAIRAGLVLLRKTIDRHISEKGISSED